MSVSRILGFPVLVVVASLALHASASQALARTDGCTACHSVEAKVVGPGFREIAAKYRGDAAAETKLTAKVRQGGSGAWGQVPMPPAPANVKDEDIQVLVKWILSLK
jgi:cytochrome c